ncbi:MAG: hypothetical protein ACTSUS_05695, partial [Candidatus Freyarchaeota archaeon]
MRYLRRAGGTLQPPSRLAVHRLRIVRFAVVLQAASVGKADPSTAPSPCLRNAKAESTGRSGLRSETGPAAGPPQKPGAIDPKGEGVMETRVAVSDLKVREDLFIRFRLDEDAVQRYMELYQSGWEKAIRVQAGTNVVIDGFHRIEACKRLGLKKILVEYVDVKDDDLLIESWISNMKHGVPPTREERDNFIIRAIKEFGKTPQQIAEIVGLSVRRIYQIIQSEKISNVNKGVTEEDKLAIAKLMIRGETQENAAKVFGVSQATISRIWAEFRDRVYKFYTEERLLKREVAEKVGLAAEEVDRILQQYGDPLNFELVASTWWPAFGLDKRFGVPHASNLPADLVRNVLALYTKPGDVILDPAAGGGVVLDVARDMVNRK